MGRISYEDKPRMVWTNAEVRFEHVHSTPEVKVETECWVVNNWWEPTVSV